MCCFGVFLPSLKVNNYLVCYIFLHINASLSVVLTSVIIKGTEYKTGCLNLKSIHLLLLVFRVFFFFIYLIAIFVYQTSLMVIFKQNFLMKKYYDAVCWYRHQC